MAARETDVTLAWHFVGKTLRDGRPIPADGEWLKHDGEIRLCARGLHASLRVIDALQYAPGATACRVALRGIANSDEDKVVARSRAILWRLDAEDVLRAFARRCALSVIDLWDAPDVVRRYLETGDEALRIEAARAAAARAAWAAEAEAEAAAEAAARAATAATAEAAEAAARAAKAEQDEWLEAALREFAGHPDDAALMDRLV